MHQLPFSSNGRPTPKKVRSGPNPPPDPLLAAYDDLNAAWNAAEEDFATMRVPVDVYSEVSKTSLAPPDCPVEVYDIFYLAWTRCLNQWRICWVKRSYNGYNEGYSYEKAEIETKPIAECPMEIRVQMAQHLRKLRRKMKEARNNYLPQVIDAVAAIKEALAD